MGFRDQCEIIIKYVLCFGVFLFFGPFGRDASGAGKLRDGLSPEQVAEQVAASVKLKTVQLLKFHVAENTALSPDDIEELNTSLKNVARYLRRFDKLHKAYYYLLEAFSAHYSGNADEALVKAQKAYQTNSLDVEVCDSVVTLALCYRKYDLARAVLNERNAGAAVRTELELPQVSFDDALAQISRGMEPKDKKDPNQPAAHKQADPNSLKHKQAGIAGADRNESGLGFLAQETTRPPGSGMFKIDVPEEFPESETTPEAQEKANTRPSRPRPPRRPPASQRLRPGMPKGILNLPVDAMIPDNLGATLSVLDLRTINIFKNPA